MAIVSTNSIIIDDQLVYGSYIERIVDNLNIFNEASRGTILLGSQGLTSGWSREETFFKKLVGNVVSRRIAASETAVTPIAFTEGSTNEIRLLRKAGPFAWQPSAFRLQGKELSVDAVSNLFGVWLADAMYADYIDVALTMVYTAINKLTNVVFNAASGVTLNTINLSKLFPLQGDLQNQVRMWVGDSVSYYKLLADQVGKNTNYSNEIIGAEVIRGGMPATYGIPFLVKDNDNLKTVVSNARTKDHILGLTSDAFRISLNGDIFSNLQTNNLKENIEVTYQLEYDYNAGLKGFKFSTESADLNPTLTTIKDASKYTYQYADERSGPGYLAKFPLT